MTTPEQRLGILSTDRPCAGCGFNLHGATIGREPHYQLLSVRCPECGLLAALQEYPAITRWAGRLRMLAAAAIVFVALLTIVVTGLITWGVSEGVSQDVCSKYARVIDIAVAKLQAETYPDSTTRQYLTPQQIEDWWKALPPSRFLADNGGYRGALNWWGSLAFIFILPLYFGIGIFWSVLFARARRWRLLVLMLAPIALGATLYYSEHYSGSYNQYYYYSTGHHAASLQVGWLPAAVTIVFCLACLWIGILLGRRVARWVVGTLLPPRLVTAFSFLWTIDDRPLPRPR